jgi:phenylalanyl-tRNA synthetase beta chain
MVVVDTSFKRLQTLTKGDLTLDILDKTLANMGMELDNVEGDEIKIEITAERTDLLTPEGLARAINCYLGYTKKYKEITVNKSNYVHKVDKAVKKYRPYTRSFVVKGLTLTDENIKSLMWIQEKMHDTYGRKRKKLAIGVYNLDLINFPLTYTAKKPKSFKFIPLEMTQELDGLQILQKHPTGRNYANLLEGCDKYPLQIDAKGQILSMPPIINSNNLGRIDVKTKDLFVECTGSDEETLDNAMCIFATMFSDWGGKVYSIKIEDGTESTTCPKVKERKRKVSVKFINDWIGLNLKPKETEKLLHKAGYNVVDSKGDLITVSIPSIRTDVWHDVDVADDVARAFSYNNIEPTLPNISTIGGMLPLNIFVEDVCDFLSTLNLIEVKTFALTNHEDQFKKMGVKPMPHITLGSNTQDKGLSMVRCWLLPEAIKALVANRNKEYPQRIFEAGIIVEPDETQDVKAKNITKLVSLLCEEGVDFTRAKQILEALMNYLGLDYTTRAIKHNSFLEGRSAKIIINKKQVGIVGEVHPQVLENWALAMPVAAFEIDLEKIFEVIKNGS